MMRISFALIVLIALFATIAKAAEVVSVEARQRYVILENDPVGTWKLGDQGCVVRGSERMGCGVIKGYSAQGAVLVLIGESKPIQAGDNTFHLIGERNLASAETSVISVAYEQQIPVKRFNVQVGTHLSLDLYYPIVELDYAVTDHVVLGIQPAYLTRSPGAGTSKLTGYGASLVASYYLLGTYRGPWGSLSSGYYAYTGSDTTNSDTSSSPAITALVGWRERWAWNSNIGAGVGVRYMPHLTGKAPTAKFSEAYPIALLTIGYEF